MKTSRVKGLLKRIAVFSLILAVSININCISLVVANSTSTSLNTSSKNNSQNEQGCRLNATLDISSQFSAIAGSSKNIVRELDYNHDNLTDLFIQTSDSKFYLYKNIAGDSRYPNWQLDSNYNFPTIPKEFGMVSVAVGDLNNDSTFDLVVGTQSGKIYFSYNINTPKNPQWTPFISLKDTSNKDYTLSIDSGTVVNPTIYDYDLLEGNDLILNTIENNTTKLYFLKQTEPNESIFASNKLSIDYKVNSTLTLTSAFAYLPFFSLTYLPLGTHTFINFQPNASQGLMYLHFITNTDTNGNEIITEFDNGNYSFYIVGGQSTLFMNIADLNFNYGNYPHLDIKPNMQFLFDNFNKNNKIMDLIVFNPSGKVYYTDEDYSCKGLPYTTAMTTYAKLKTNTTNFLEFIYFIFPIVALVIFKKQKR